MYPLAIKALSEIALEGVLFNSIGPKLLFELKKNHGGTFFSPS